MSDDEVTATPKELAFVAWLKAQGIYNPMASTASMQVQYRVWDHAGHPGYYENFHEAHDAVIDSLKREKVSDEELLEIIVGLPESIHAEIRENGFDTVARDNIYEYLQGNKPSETEREIELTINRNPGFNPENVGVLHLDILFTTEPPTLRMLNEIRYDRQGIIVWFDTTGRAEEYLEFLGLKRQPALASRLIVWQISDCAGIAKKIAEIACGACEMPDNFRPLMAVHNIVGGQ